MKTGKHKIKYLNLFRLLIQIAFFIILPALYINAFAGIKQIYLSIIHGSFNIVSLWPQIIETVAIIPITMLIGRFFCGWMCAFGTLGDLIYLVSNKIFKIKFRISEKADRVLKYVKYVVLAFLVIVVWSFGIKAFSTSNPWDVFGIIATFGKTPDLGYAISTLTPGFIIFMVMVVGSFFVERFFCRYLCPLGAIFSIVSKIRITKIQKPSDKCGNCRICTQTCAMGIPLYKGNECKSGECINCFKCISACPRKNVCLTVADEDLRPVIAGTMAVAVITGMYYVGSLTAAPVEASYSTASSTSQGINSNSNNLYKDGTYEGSGIGFRGATTTVSVTVESDKLTDIQVVSYGDDGPFFNRAYPTVIDEILSTQSTEVDAVSGATYSSNGIMSAVADALSNASSSLTATTSEVSNQASDTQAAVSSATDSTTTSDTQSEASQSTQSASTPDSTVDNQESSSASVQSNPASSSSKDTQYNSSVASESSATNTKYKDGTYEGSGTGFRGATTTVSVTVKSDKITDVQVVSYGDDRPFFNRAYPTVIDEILSTQSTEVDAVSGATYSSNGIMSAVADALSNAGSQTSLSTSTQSNAYTVG